MTTKKAQERERQRQQVLAREKRARAWKYLGALITVFSLYTSAPALITRLSINPSSSLDPADALSTPFAVSNDGNYDLHEVKYACVYIDLTLRSGSKISTPGPYGDWLGGFTTNLMATDILEPTVKRNIQCPTGGFGPITQGNIIVIVSYRPSWWPFRYQKHKHFVTARAADGSLVWLEEPMPR
jgi:hypothetical protein